MSATPAAATAPLTAAELHDAWLLLTTADRLDAFHLLAPGDADDFFLGLSTREQPLLIRALPEGERRLWLRLLPPDDAADLLQSLPRAARDGYLAALDERTRTEVRALLSYAEDQAGGLMSPRYGRVRPESTVAEALSYLRRQVKDHVETLYYAYVLDDEQHLKGVVSVHQLFAGDDDARVADIMRRDPITVPETLDQEHVARLMSRSGLLALPVVDAAGQMLGIVTVDDVVDVVQEEATEDIQKLGGVESLGAPYLQVSLAEMLRKRGVWLAVLFVGELLTATAMGAFEAELSKAVVLALFVPLVISSGGNSGSQATTLIIRAMALGEVRLRDWWKVVRREFLAGLGLGVMLGTLGFTRILIWQAAFHTYGAHALVVACTVAASLVGVVLWGTMAGSMLPFLLRRVGVDPASASAPFVATLVDVTGLIIYFTVARVVMAGSLL